MEQILDNDPRVVDQQPRDAAFIERQDPNEPGAYASDFFLFVAKRKDRDRVDRYEWRVNARVEPNDKSELIIQGGHGGQSKNALAVSEDGDVELLQPGSGVVLPSPDGARWRLTVDNAGVLKAVPLQ
jgi:hypothetical protein